MGTWDLQIKPCESQGPGTLDSTNYRNGLGYFPSRKKKPVWEVSICPTEKKNNYSINAPRESKVIEWLGVLYSSLSAAV